MNAKNIKIRLFFIKFMDWLLLGLVLFIGMPFVILSDHRPLYALAVLIALALVSRIGDWSLSKIAELQILLNHIHKGNMRHSG